MKYRFKELIYRGGHIVKERPKSHDAVGEVAIIVHLFYLDLWREIYSYLKDLSLSFDLYISVPSHIKLEDLKEIFEDMPNTHIYMVENRGRDVLPFLQILSHIGLESYSYICKLHTKKTGDSPLGHVWRKLLYFDLIGSQEWVEEIVETFKSNPKVGQITGKNTVLDSKRYAYGNNGKIKWLCKECGVPFREEYTFAGGTMFWSRTDILKPLMDLFESGRLKFEEERGQKDHTIAHAIERFFGILVQVKGMEIVPSPANYNKLPGELAEQTAALVLSQQYAGQDVYEKINELNELVEYMRLKNRFKRLPKKVVERSRSKLVTLQERLIDLSEEFKSGEIKQKIAPVAQIAKNPQVLKKVWYYLKRGEIKYLYTKAKEKIKKNLANSKDYVTIEPKEYFTRFNAKEYSLAEEVVDIIIPVYNGFEYLKPLFGSIKRNTTAAYRLIVVEDCSLDEKVKPLLKELLKEHKETILIENEENLGFVKSVNRALQKVENDFVILNTDTEVPPLWLERLLYPIKKMERIASTTPFTNSGTIASFPKFLEDNAIFEGLPLEEIDKHFMDVNAKNQYATIPTGVGFCMGVNYRLTQEIGFFDETSFGKGYGEENDWCQRAIKSGYSNLLVPNLYVYHKHGGSFSANLKQQLLGENYAKLLQKHPNYDKQVDAYIQKNPHKILRKLLIITISSSANPLWVIFDHAIGGGANYYAKQLLQKQIEAGRNTLKISYDYYTDEYKCNYHYKEYQFDFILKSVEAIEELLNYCQIEEVFLNSLVSYPQQKETLEMLERLTNREFISLTIPIHDYFAICPSYNLLDDSGNYCGVPSVKRCNECMQKSKQEWKNFFSDEIDILSWRELWAKLLHKSTTILLFSNASKALLQKVYPEIKESQLKLLPHRVEDLKPLQMLQKSAQEPFVIGILGGINYSKGAAIVKELVALIEQQRLNIDIVVIGEITEMISSRHFKVTGRYDRTKLPKLIQNYKIDLFLIPSIWPETFSYTSEEVMQMELPLMVFNIGAPAERVKEYPKGYIVDEVSAKAVLEKIKEEFL